MRAVDVHEQVQAIAVWLAQSMALRERIRIRHLPPWTATRASGFVEVVIEWEKAASC